MVRVSTPVGEVLERLNRPVSKTGVGVTPPWVRIPPSPFDTDVKFSTFDTARRRRATRPSSTRIARYRRGRVGVVLPAVLWILTGTALAQESGFYAGVPAAAERLRVFYEKAVDNTDPRNMSPSEGRVYRADDTAAGAAGGVGFLAGYRVPLGPNGVYLSGDGDVIFPGGAARGRFEGAGASPGRTQLGESWP